ncbi:MAG: VWA domain-containing protein [Pirellulaceae bacterium]
MKLAPNTSLFYKLANVLNVSVVICLSGCARQSPLDGEAQPAASISSAMVKSEDFPLQVQHNTEEYEAIEENDFIQALQQPQSTFSIDVDTASYANVRRMLRQGNWPPAGAVRLEELVNYFSYDYPEPEGEHPFSVIADVAPCPWKEGHQLLRIGLRGQSIEFQERESANLVFLLDVSGSMLAPNKLPLVKSAMKMLTQELRPEDRIAIAVYAGASGLALDSTPASNSAEILGALESLEAGGSTNGGAGIRLAYATAREHFSADGINRVILCTDGDFNVGTTNESELVELIQEEAKSDIFLTVLGFGGGNLKDSKMEKLADLGNGNYAYIDSKLEARKVLVEEVGATLKTIAKDVKIQVDFNPRHVQAYRLLGYENRLLDNQDFRDDRKDAGEIGAGHRVTAFYELVPTGNETFQESRSSEFVTQELSEHADVETRLTVNLRYKQPDADVGQEFQVRVSASAMHMDAPRDMQFATAVLAYGMLLRGSSHIGNLNWDWVVETAERSAGDDPRGLRAEFLALTKTAKRLAATR